MRNKGILPKHGLLGFWLLLMSLPALHLSSLPRSLWLPKGSPLPCREFCGKGPPIWEGVGDGAASGGNRRFIPKPIHCCPRVSPIKAVQRKRQTRTQRVERAPASQQVSQIHSGDEAPPLRELHKQMLNYISSTGINSPKKTLKLIQIKLLHWLAACSVSHVQLFATHGL